MLSRHLPNAWLIPLYIKNSECRGIIKFPTVVTLQTLQFPSCQTEWNILQGLELFHWHWAVKSSSDFSSVFIVLLFVLFCFFLQTQKQEGWFLSFIKQWSSIKKCSQTLIKSRIDLFGVRTGKPKHHAILHMIKIRRKRVCSNSIVAKPYF